MSGVSRRAVAFLPPGQPDGRPPQGVELVAIVRSGEVADALHHLAAGETDALYAPRLAALVHSLGELTRLLDWLQEAGATLISDQPPLDTADAEGRRAAALLREVDRWDREPEHPRRPRGRPGLAAAAPHVAQRIAELREQGLSLHAIAAQLNREGVPTPRGGSTWRASSVQAALGYRRPRPPAPGAPPPPRPPGPRGPRHAPGNDRPPPKHRPRP